MLTASVVLYHTPKNLIEQVIKSYSPSKERRLFLINNAPETREQYRCFMDTEGLEYLEADRNLGYGRAHNIGICKAITLQSDYHIVMNPDVYYDPDCIDRLADYADAHSDVVCILPKVFYPDYKLQHLCKLLPTPWDLLLHRFVPKVGFFKKLNDSYILRSTGYNRIMNPPCLSGCFMFLRTSVLQEHEMLFDERFFMYCEDVDLVRRLHRHGRTEFYPYVHIFHVFGGASHKNWRMLFAHAQSAVRYFNKYGWFLDRERTEMNRRFLEEYDMEAKERT